MTGLVTASTSTRIGFVSAFPPGRNSLNEYGYHFVTALAGKPEVREVVVFADETPDGATASLPGVTIVPAWRFNSIGNLLRIVRTVRRSKVDAVIFNLQFATFGDTKVAGGLGLLAPMALRLSGVPTIVLLHNLTENVDMQDAGFAGSKVMAWVMKSAGRLLTKALLKAHLVGLTIPKYVELVRDTYRADNVFLAPHGTFEIVDEPSFADADGPLRIMAFGKWGTYKRVEPLVAAYRTLRERTALDCELVIAGTDSPNSPGYVDGVAADNADLPGLRFTGYVAEEDVAELFGSSAVVAFPYTSTTGSSGVLHQAGSYGCAVVLPQIGDFVEVIEEEGFVGEYFEPGDDASLADAIERLLRDPARREEQGRRNYAASVGVPIADVADWYLVHLDRLADARS